MDARQVEAAMAELGSMGGGAAATLYVDACRGQGESVTLTVASGTFELDPSRLMMVRRFDYEDWDGRHHGSDFVPYQSIRLIEVEEVTE